MVDYKCPIPNVLKAVYGSLRRAGLIAGVAIAIVKIAPYQQQPQITYGIQEMPAYPMTDDEGRLVPLDMRAKLTGGSGGKVLRLTVRNNGKNTTAGVLVRFNFSPVDGYVRGWMSKSQAPFGETMLDTETQYRLSTLVPADEATFYLYLKNVNSDLADRIEVFRKGERAAYYRYLPVRQLGGNDIVIPIRRSWIGLICFILLMILLPSISRQRGGCRPSKPVLPQPIEEARVDLGVLSERPLPATGRQGPDEVILRRSGM